MVVDACTYNGERELWDLHYNVLKDYVDQFIVVEFDKTFSGKHKYPLFPVERYPNVAHHFVREAQYKQYQELADSSPNTVGADHWKREFMQKECLKDALKDLKDSDVVFVGDVDEIWSPEALKIKELPLKLKLDVYTYYLNNRSSEQFWGTLMAPYAIIKDQCLNHLRQNAPKSKKTLGWHFTSMGGPVSLRKKLTDSYTDESYATPEVLQNLDRVYGDNDFLGRNFSYTIDESQWPPYLVDQRERFRHLLRPTTSGATTR